MGTREPIVCLQVLLVIIVKVVAGGNQGANSLPPSFTCHYCKEVAGGNQGANSLPPSFTCHYCKGSGWW